MRFLLVCLAMVAAFGLGAPALAETLPQGPWRGVWTGLDANGAYEYQAELSASADTAGHVQGQFTWMLVRSPRPAEQVKIGMRGIEYVEGEYDIATGALIMHGVRLDDPNHILGLDVYRLAVSPDGQYIAGITANNGTWRGRIDLSR